MGRTKGQARNGKRTVWNKINNETQENKEEEQSKEERISSALFSQQIYVSQSINPEKIVHHKFLSVEEQRRGHRWKSKRERTGQKGNKGGQSGEKETARGGSRRQTKRTGQNTRKQKRTRPMKTAFVFLCVQVCVCAKTMSVRRHTDTHTDTHCSPGGGGWEWEDGVCVQLWALQTGRSKAPQSLSANVEQTIVKRARFDFSSLLLITEEQGLKYERQP